MLPIVAIFDQPRRAIVRAPGGSPSTVATPPANPIERLLAVGALIALSLTATGEVRGDDDFPRFAVTLANYHIASSEMFEPEPESMLLPAPRRPWGHTPVAWPLRGPGDGLSTRGDPIFRLVSLETPLSVSGGRMAGDGSTGFTTAGQEVGGGPGFAPSFDPPSEFESAAPPDGFTVRSFTWQDDWHDLRPMLRGDLLSLFTWQNGVLIGLGVGEALVFRDDVDGNVREWTAEHPDRWGYADTVLRQFGEMGYQAAAIVGLYASSLYFQEDRLHEFSKALLSAYALNLGTTMAIKGIVDTSRPSDVYLGGHYGFPSYHTSSTFAIAAVIDEYFGWPAGLPAYVLAGLVGWSRIDQREHDVSDVAFGAILGYVIGRSVAMAHLERYSGFRVQPYYESTTHTVGCMLHLSF